VVVVINIMDYKIKELNVSDIKPDKNQPRKTFDDEALQHLAESILSNGLLNPIEVDENYIITDGERRWRAHKVAGLKNITARIVSNKDKTDKLRRQLIFTLQDEEIPTEERYDAIVRLYQTEGPSDKTAWCKKLGIIPQMLNQAMQYTNFVEDEPETAKRVAPHIIIETASLPKEERMEVLKEFEGTKDKKKDLIRELVKDKREKIQLQKNLEEIKKTKDMSIKITNTKEQLEELSSKFSEEIERVGRVISYFRYMKRTKLYVADVRTKDKFFRNLDSQIDRLERYVQDLKTLKENLELEIVKE
jgi:ParB/RepB/Spo0J family partition protein